MAEEYRIEIPIEVKDTSSQERLQKLESLLKQIQGSYKTTGQEAQKAGEKGGSAFREAGSEVDRFSQRVEKSRQTLAKAFKDKIKMTIAAIDKATPALKNIGATVKNITSKAWNVAVKMTDFVTAPFRKLKNLITSPIVMTLSMAGISMGAGSFVSTFSEFGASMSNVKALSGATNDEFQRLTATAEKLGAKTKFTATQSAEGMQYLAMAGWKTNDIIAAMPGLLDLAAAGATDLGVAADIVSDVMTAMGMSSDQASRAADVFARTATSTNTTIENLGETLKYAAPIAHSFGLELADVSALTGMMANAGIKGSQAGTAIRSSLMAMASPAKDAQDVMKKLGLSFADQNGKMKDMSTIISDLSKAFAGLSEQDKLAYADSLFGKYASSAWLGVISQGADEYERLFAAIDQSEGAAKEMANTQLDNLAGDMTLLQSATDGMKISLMKELNPYLRAGVQWLTGKIPVIEEKLKSMISTGIEKAKELKERFTSVFSSSDFQNADGFAQKFIIAWDKIIAEPFNNWWNGGGRDTVLSAVGKLGKGVGDMYHGIITGIFAALKGEEIDFEGLNLTGIAKAGAEAAKEFVGSFIEAFDLGDIISKAPGLLKAGMMAFGGMKIGGTVLGLAKDISTVKVAFSGVSTAAAATAGTVGKSVSMFTLLKTALAAIPGWGWVAAAAITALTVAAVEYSKAQDRERQSMLHLGDDAKAAAEQYEESAKNVQEASELIDGIHTVEFQIARGENYTKEITEIQSDLAVISDRKHYITLLLQGANYTEKEVADCKKKLDEVNGYIAYIEAQLAAGTITPEEAAEYQKQLEVLQGQRVELEAQLAGSTLTKEEVEQYQQELEALKGKEVELKAKLAEDTVRLTQVTEYMTELSALKGREEEIKMNLEKGVTPEEAEQYMQELEVIHGRTEEITIKLNGLGVTTFGILYAESLLNQIDGMEATAEVLLQRTGLDSAAIEGIKTELKSIETRKAQIEITMEGSQMTEEEVKAVKDELAAIENKTANIQAAMTGDLSEKELKELADEYQKLKSQWAYLTLKLSGSGLDDTQLEAIAAEYASLESKEATITAGLAESGMTKDDIQKVFDLYAGIGDKTAELTISFSTGSLKTEDLEAAQNALDSMYERLAEMSGGAFTAEELKNGETSLEQAKEIVEQVAETSLIATRAMVEKAKPNVDTALGMEEYYNGVGSQFSLAADEMDERQRQLELLELKRQNALAKYRYFDAKEANGTLTADEQAEYDRLMNHDTGAFRNIQDQYQALTGRDVTFFQLLDNEQSPFMDWIEGAYSRYYGANAANSRADADQIHSTLADLYQAEKVVAEGEATIGTGYVGTRIEDLAANYGGLDETGMGIFAKALTGMAQVNSGATYIPDSEKVDIAALVEQAKQSVMASYLADTIKGEGGLDAFNGATSQNVETVEEALKSIEGMDFTKTQELFTKLGGDSSSSGEKVRTLQAQLDALAKDYTVNIHINQIGSAEVSIPEHATGGLFNQAHFGVVAEDGPEAIIPLGSKRRERGLALWEAAGRMLGVNEYADGGILAPYGSMLERLSDEAFGGGGDSPNLSGGGGGGPINVTVSANPSFVIEGGGSSDEILAVIKSKQKELAEMLGAAFADELEDIVTNMV